MWIKFLKMLSLSQQTSDNEVQSRSPLTVKSPLKRFLNTGEEFAVQTCSKRKIKRHFQDTSFCDLSSQCQRNSQGCEKARCLFHCWYLQWDVGHGTFALGHTWGEPSGELYSLRVGDGKERVKKDTGHKNTGRKKRRRWWKNQPMKYFSTFCELCKMLWEKETWKQGDTMS